MVNLLLQRMKGGEQCPPRKSFSKIAWSWLGAFTGIYLISVISRLTYFNIVDNFFIVGSFGASAVLLYAAPQVEYSQPRNLLGGHIISAVIGVTVYKFINVDIAILGALAVSLSIVAMHLTRTIHPPGGATALIAVIGSAEVHNAGYLFVAVPIASSALIMLVVALVVNNLSNNPKRHYPRFWW